MEIGTIIRYKRLGEIILSSVKNKSGVCVNLNTVRWSMGDFGTSYFSSICLCLNENNESTYFIHARDV